MISINQIKKRTLLLLTLLCILCSGVVQSCRKDNSTPLVLPGNNSGGQGITTTIMGQVVQEDGSPLASATVKIGNNTYTTDARGGFYFSKIATSSHATVVEVTKNGYMSGYRTLTITANQDASVRIRMIKLQNPATVNSSAGGTVTIAGGGSVIFPANAMVAKGTNSPYTGTVSVYSKWLDPTIAETHELMPGALRGLAADGSEKALESYGMIAVELFDNAGNALQIAPGKTAQLTFPVPADLSAKAPGTVPLWYFDSNTGMWKEEGQATKTGSDYVCNVTHFSFWNCDAGPGYVNFDITFVDQDNNPIVNSYIDIVNTDNGCYRSGITNSKGFVGGLVPGTANLKVILRGTASCNNVNIYSKTFSTGSLSLSLGTVSATVPSNNKYQVSGTVVDCSGNPVADAMVSIYNASEYNLIWIKADKNGNFKASFTSCTSSYTFTIYDPSNFVSGTFTQTLSAGNNNLGNLSACGNLIEYVNYSVTTNGTTQSFKMVEPNPIYASYYNNLTHIQSYENSGNFCYFTFSGSNSTGGTHLITGYSDSLDNTDSMNYVPNISVTVTKHGAVGDYIEGSFNGTYTGERTGLTRTVNMSFRAKRDQ